MNQEKQDLKPELVDNGLKEEYSPFEGANTPYCEPCMLMPKSKLI